MGVVKIKQASSGCSGEACLVFTDGPGSDLGIVDLLLLRSDEFAIGLPEKAVLRGCVFSNNDREALRDIIRNVFDNKTVSDIVNSFVFHVDGFEACVVFASAAVLDIFALFANICFPFIVIFYIGKHFAFNERI